VDYFNTAQSAALHKQGVARVGASNEMSKNEPDKIYLLVTYPSLDAYTTIKKALVHDAEYQKASKSYNEIPASTPVYYRYESSLMLAFDGLPKLTVPKKEERIFELRTYQGYSEDAVRRKIKMFNNGEFDIFYRTKLNPVFFGEVIAGKDLPCLTYMISFKDMEERDHNWNNFLQDPAWLKISKDPQYENSVSSIIRIFLIPTDYSQI